MARTSNSINATEREAFASRYIFDDVPKQKTTFFCFSDNTTIAFLFNKNGVSPKRFCQEIHNPPAVLRALNGSDRLITKEFIKLSLTNKIKSMKYLIGGRLDGLVVQSSFWDLQDFLLCGNLTRWQNPSDNHHIQSFLETWRSDCDNFVAALNDAPVFNQTFYKAWRTFQSPRHYPHRGQRKNYWTNDIGQKMMYWMRNASLSIAKSYSWDIIKFHEFEKVNETRGLTDCHHPNKNTSINLIKYALGRLEAYEPGN